MFDSRLIGLIVVFAPLSLFSFGGGQAIVADIQHQTVEVHRWLTEQQFTDMFALSRAAPGPATLIAALIGWQVYGFVGSVVATLAIYVPSSVVLYGAVSWWLRRHGSPWKTAIEQGLAPVAVGLIFAGVLAVTQAAHLNALGFATTAISATVLYFTKLSPYVLIGAAVMIFTALQFV